ncbi:gliding motility-associated C-terminal domain-containing protein [Algibacter sp. TI.3.09]|uniref:T9SS type B sorting domain-containing protein n=1 Tax=Algibacter sp. TI.3.09 TaxID=3121298 RepID=UPI00311F63F3
MKRLSVFAFFVLSFTNMVSAQIVISKPNLGFSQACAGPAFNTYYATFSFSPEGNLEASNQFIIELSDENGDFTNSTDIYISDVGSVIKTPATLEFSIPTTTTGENFKIKIRSTAPVATSSASNGFPAYYKIQDTPFSINNLIDTGSYCSGGSYLLTIDNPGSLLNDSPLQYPSLTFNWYLETGPTTSVFIASGSTLAVDTAGVYFVETDYGTCTSNSFSNRVSVSEIVSSSATFDINSSVDIPYCATEGPTTLTSINGNAYQWYLNGTEIEGATSQMYTTNTEGIYSVSVDLGSCSSSASIEIINTNFTASIDVPEFNSIEAEENLVVTASTTAVDPEFKWYLNETLIASANSDSYEATQSGNYKVEVIQTSGCVSTKTFLFEVEKALDLFPDVALIPNIVSPNNDGENDTWVIPKDYVSGTNAEVVIFSTQGKVVFKSDDYQNNWPENQLSFTNISPVYYYIITTSTGEKQKGSITIIK